MQTINTIKYNTESLYYALDYHYLEVYYAVCIAKLIQWTASQGSVQGSEVLISFRFEILVPFCFTKHHKFENNPLTWNTFHVFLQGPFEIVDCTGKLHEATEDDWSDS